MVSQSGQEFPTATFGQRILSRFIDTLLVSILAYGIALILAQNNNGNNTNSETLFQGIPGLLFFFVYYPITEFLGGTVGKELLKLKTISSRTGKRITITQAYHRSLILCWPFFLFAIGFFLFGSGYGSGLTMIAAPFLTIAFLTIPPLGMLWRKDKRGYHDFWTDVVIIDTKKKTE